MPSFLNQANKAKQSEAKSYIGAMNRAQQAYYLENNGFAADLEDLAIGLGDTENYNYSSTSSGVGATAKALSTARQKNGSILKGYVGLVELKVNEAGATSTGVVICESEDGVQAIAPVDSENCGNGQRRL